MLRSGKGIGQRADEAGIAFDDVRIVEDRQRHVGGGRGQQRRRDRARLQDVQAGRVDRPFHILRRAERRLGPAGERGDRGRLGHRQYGRGPGADRRFGHGPVLAVGLARNQPFAQPGDGRDHDDVAPPADRIGGKGDPGRPRVDHALDDHGGALGRSAGPERAIGGDALAETRRPDGAGGLGHAARRDVQMGGELARMAVPGSVLGAGGTAHGKGTGAERGQRPGQPVDQAAPVEGIGPDDEEGRRGKAVARQMRQRGGLAADLVHPRGGVLRDDMRHQKAPGISGAKPASA